MNEGELLFSLFISKDDFETVLGSHSGKQKFGGVYVSIATLPPHMLSKLRYIMLTLLCKSSDRKDFGNKAIFQPLVDELNDLCKKGIAVRTSTRVYTVYFQLVLMIGDNLGQNEIFEFVQNFNHGKPCRTCSVDIEGKKTLCIEKTELLRTLDTYKSDLSMNDTSLTGVKEDCIFDSIEEFNIFPNGSYDLLHNELEGRISYTIVNLLNSFIYVTSFSL